MKFDLKTPCPDCPFLVEPYFYLRPGQRARIAQDIAHDKTFPCHKTVDYDNFDTIENEETGDEEEVYDPSGKEQHCAGALITMMKGKEIWRNFLFRLALVSKLFYPDKMDMSAKVYRSLKEFVADQREDNRHVETERKGTRQIST